MHRYLSTRSRPMRRWQLGEDLGDVFSQMERLISQPMISGRTAFEAGPYPIDLYETDEAVVLEMAVPGISHEQLDISIEGRQLTIHGVLPEVEDEEDEATHQAERRYWVRSIPRGEFQRTVTIPSGVNADEIDAAVNQGLLTLTMPKATEAKARKISIRQHQLEQ